MNINKAFTFTIKKTIKKTNHAVHASYHCIVVQSGVYQGVEETGVLYIKNTNNAFTFKNTNHTVHALVLPLSPSGICQGIELLTTQCITNEN